MEKEDWSDFFRLVRKINQSGFLPEDVPVVVLAAAEQLELSEDWLAFLYAIGLYED